MELNKNPQKYKTSEYIENLSKAKVTKIRIPKNTRIHSIKSDNKFIVRVKEFMKSNKTVISPLKSAGNLYQYRAGKSINTIYVSKKALQIQDY